jgi:predicted RND superfamily exporter protein
LIRVFGVWAAAGTALAYVLTFTFGGALLALAPRRAAPPRWPARFALGVVRASVRRPGAVLAAWAFVLLLAAAGASRLHVAVRFPHVFAPREPVAAELEAMQELTGTDLAPLEIYVEPSDEDGRRPVPFASALMTVSRYVGTLPETRHVLPRDLLGERPFTPGRGPLAEQLTGIAEDPRLAPWIRFEEGAGRIQVHFAPMSFERRREIATWLHRFDEEMLSHHRLSLGGPGRHYVVAEERGLRGTLVGGVLTLLVVAGALAWSFRRPAPLVAALVGNLVPLLLVAGVMGALGIPWSLAVIPLPAVLLGLAVDDTVHLLWPARRGGRGASRGVSRGAARAGPALLATTAVLAACIASMTLSGLRVNRELGLLLPAGLLLALACDLSLVPALLRGSSRRR